jgi:hypothetical protein
MKNNEMAAVSNGVIMKQWHVMKMAKLIIIR